MLKLDKPIPLNFKSVTELMLKEFHIDGTKLVSNSDENNSVEFNTFLTAMTKIFKIAEVATSYVWDLYRYPGVSVFSNMYESYDDKKHLPVYDDIYIRSNDKTINARLFINKDPDESSYILKVAVISDSPVNVELYEPNELVDIDFNTFLKKK